MEKLGVSTEDLREDLKRELTALVEQKTSLTKTGDVYGDSYRDIEARIHAVKDKLNKLEGA